MCETPDTDGEVFDIEKWGFQGPSRPSHASCGGCSRNEPDKPRSWVPPTSCSPPESEPEELSVAGLGPLSRETIHLSGALDGTAFGVRHANGVSMSWKTGDEPARDLADNPRLSGTAT